MMQRILSCWLSFMHPRGINALLLLGLLALSLLLSGCTDDGNECLLPAGDPLHPQAQPRATHIIDVPANGLHAVTTDGNNNVVNVYGGWLATNITVDAEVPKFQVTSLGEAHPCAIIT
jgi:hypothetical protein